MNLYLAVVLAFGSVCAVRGGTDCSLSYSDRWIDYGREVSVECPISNPNWWVITDPCKPENANQLSGCSDTFCMVESAVYLTEEFYIVCCTGSSVNRFSTDVDYSCEIIRECPVILVTTPTQAATGSSVNIQTEITSKIHPQNDSVTVMASHVGVAGGTFTNLNVLTDGANYPVPLTANNYTFFHSFPVPASAVTGDFVQIVVDVSKIPHGRQCVYTNSVARHTTFIQVGNSGAVGSTTDNNEALATQCLNGGLSNDYGFALEYISAGIGASIGVGATILVLLLITAVLLFVKHRCRSLKRPPHPCNDLVERALSASEVLAILDADSDDDTELVSLDLDAESDDDGQPAGDFMSPDGTQSLVPNNVLSFSGAFHSLILDDTEPSHRDSLLFSDLSLPDQDHMLLGTAANTPSSSEADRKLDFSSSQDTPATTPTEDDALLNQHLPSPSPPSDPGSSYASIKTKGPCPSYSVVMTGNASSALITGTSPPPYPPSKMTSTRISHAVPSASLQLTTQQHCSELRPCTLEPSSLPSQHPPPHAGYHTQGEAIFLTKKYVNGQEAYI